MKLTAEKNPDLHTKAYSVSLVFPTNQVILLIKKTNTVLVLTAFCFCLGVLSSCKKDTIITNSSAKLSFSTDSVLFDTVFTTVGSTVRGFLVRNTASQPINISSIKLAGNYTSPFKINVDGIAGASFSNIKIPAKDSIFVFVTCTLNPNNQNNPIVIEDSLVFSTNGNTQNVYLEAYGQDAYFFKPNVFPPSGPAYCIIPCSNSTWTALKPYVIFGYAIDTGCTLTMQPGTRVYFHNNGVLWIYANASLQVQGNQANPVTFQGDRLEPEYKYVPGQWGEIWLSPGSKNNMISWAVIKNGTIGVEADTNVTPGVPTLQMDHTIIKSMSEFGLLGEGSFITGDNNLIEDCKYYDLDLSLGGKYRFYQCTFANYWSYSQRQTPLLLLNNHYTDVNGNNQSRNLDSAFFTNCIVYGSVANEVALDAQGGTFHYYFDHCNVKTPLPAANYTACISADPSFNATGEPPSDDYRVTSNSAAIGSGTNTYGTYAPDLSGGSILGTPTIGAYQQ